MNIEDKIYNEIGINPSLINIGYGKYLQRKYKDDDTRNNIINELRGVYRYIEGFYNHSNKIYIHDMRRTQRNKIINMLEMLVDNIIMKFNIKNLKSVSKSHDAIYNYRMRRNIKRNKKIIRKIINELNLRPFTI